jgi:hypothetical protein
MDKHEFINQVGEILKTRGEAYGDARMLHQDIADMWTIITGNPISIHDVPMMMIALKLARNSYKIKQDNWADIAGYAAIGAELLDEDNVVPYDRYSKD